MSFDKNKFPDEAAYEEAAIFSATLMCKSQGSDQKERVSRPGFPTVALSDSLTMGFIPAFADMETPPPLPQVIRRAQKPCHREGSLLLNSVGKSPFTSYSACSTEARLT